MKRLGSIAAIGLIGATAAVGFVVPDEAVQAPTAATPATAPTSSTAPTPATSLAPVREGRPVVAAAASEAIGSAASSEAIGSAAASEAIGSAAASGVIALETFTGSASYYADKFEGRTTASGVPFRQAEMWAAHRTLPFGTRLRVTNLSNGRTVEAEVVDRGPYARGRVLDLSRSAARALGFIRAGHTRVKIEVLQRP